MSTHRAPAQVAEPLDPRSERGRELARDLTLALDEIEEQIAARKTTSTTSTAKEKAA